MPHWRGSMTRRNRNGFNNAKTSPETLSFDEQTINFAQPDFGATIPSSIGGRTFQVDKSLFENASVSAPQYFGNYYSGDASTPIIGLKSRAAGTTIKFNPVEGIDTVQGNGGNSTISTKYHCITCMKEYEGKSLEELRCEDYIANRQGVTQDAQTGSVDNIGYLERTQQPATQLTSRPLTCFTQPEFEIDNESSASGQTSQVDTHSFEDGSTTQSFDDHDEGSTAASFEQFDRTATGLSESMTSSCVFPSNATAANIITINLNPITGTYKIVRRNGLTSTSFAEYDYEDFSKNEEKLLQSKLKVSKWFTRGYYRKKVTSGKDFCVKSSITDAANKFGQSHYFCSTRSDVSNSDHSSDDDSDSVTDRFNDSLQIASEFEQIYECISELEIFLKSEQAYSDILETVIEAQHFCKNCYANNKINTTELITRILEDFFEYCFKPLNELELKYESEASADTNPSTHANSTSTPKPAGNSITITTRTTEPGPDAYHKRYGDLLETAINHKVAFRESLKRAQNKQREFLEWLWLEPVMNEDEALADLDVVSDNVLADTDNTDEINNVDTDNTAINNLPDSSPVKESDHESPDRTVQEKQHNYDLFEKPASTTSSNVITSTSSIPSSNEVVSDSDCNRADGEKSQPGPISNGDKLLLATETNDGNSSTKIPVDSTSTDLVNGTAAEFESSKEKSSEENQNDSAAEDVDKNENDDLSEEESGAEESESEFRDSIEIPIGETEQGTSLVPEPKPSDNSAEEPDNCISSQIVTAAPTNSRSTNEQIEIVYPSMESTDISGQLTLRNRAGFTSTSHDDIDDSSETFEAAIDQLLPAVSSSTPELNDSNEWIDFSRLSTIVMIPYFCVLFLFVLIIAALFYLNSSLLHFDYVPH